MAESKSTKRYVIGLDISLTSPGVCVHDSNVNEYTFYFSKQRKRDPVYVEWSGLYEGKQTHLKFVQMQRYDAKDAKSSRSRSSDQKLPRWSVYNWKSNILCDVVRKYPPADTDLYIEGYSYCSQGGSAPTKLYEFGGVLRTKLHECGYSLVEVAPTRIKSLFTGSGKSKKLDMYNRWIELHLPNLYEIFLFPKVPKHIPKPIEDVVDAFALCSTCNYM